MTRLNVDEVIRADTIGDYVLGLELSEGDQVILDSIGEDLELISWNERLKAR